MRKKVLEPVEPHVQHPTWGQEVTVKMQGVLEDHTVVEKDWKLVFVVGEGDVTQVGWRFSRLNQISFVWTEIICQRQQFDDT